MPESMVHPRPTHFVQIDKPIREKKYLTTLKQI